MRSISLPVGIVFVQLLGACASSHSNAVPNGANASAAPLAAASTPKAWICPVCGAEIVGPGQVGYYGLWEVHFCSRPDAEQFAAMPKEKRAKMAASQVLPQKKISNTVCPLTGDTLTAAAAPVIYEGVVIGFASQADANQFTTLPAARKKSVIDQWKSSSGGSGGGRA